MARNAFKRAKAMAAQIKAALESCIHLVGQPLEYKRSLDEKLRGIGPYVSRGHGLNRPSYAHGRGSRGGNNGLVGYPHQGGQECARRMVGGWAQHFFKSGGQTKRQAIAASNLA